MYPSSCHKPKRANPESIGTEVRSKKECARRANLQSVQASGGNGQFPDRKVTFQLGTDLPTKGQLQIVTEGDLLEVVWWFAALCADRLMTQLPVSMKGGDNRFGWLTG